MLKRGMWHDLSLGVIDLMAAYPLYRDDLLLYGGRECYHFKDYVINWTQEPTHEDDLRRGPVGEP